MKYLVLLISIFCLLFTSCKSKKGMLKYDIFSCEEGADEAVKDAVLGKYELISYGLIYRIEADGFNQFHRGYLAENYNIILSLGGCIVTEGGNCYREKIEALIYEKYGDDIFEVAKLEAIEEFRNTKEFAKDIKPQIDSGKVYWKSMLHEEPKFTVENEEVDFLKYLGFVNFKEDYYNAKNYCKISFIVEKDGKMSDIQLENAETEESIINNDLMDKLNEVSSWKPGVYLGEIVRSYTYFKVPLSLL